MRAVTDTLDSAALSARLEELGRKARAFRFDVAPNPCVGAALYAGKREVARGFHRFFGGPHAEIEALSAARTAGGDLAIADTLVVTLEPCSSEGKTPPCVDAILASGVRRVVVGSLDPDPRHRGRGLERLREAGLEVELLETAAPLSLVAPHFLKWNDPDRTRRPRPWCLAKWAQTRSGKLVPPADVGGGRWISGPGSQAEVQVLRSHVDAILTGVGTVLADDPRFTVRPPADPARPPLRVVLDSYLRTPPEARLFEPPGEGEGAGRCVIICQPGVDGARYRALEKRGAELVRLASNETDHLSLRDVHTWLWGQGVRRLLVEAGPSLLGRHLELGFVDQLRVYTGNVNGGRGRSMGEWLSRVKLPDRDDRECGEDAVLEAFLE